MTPEAQKRRAEKMAQLQATIKAPEWDISADGKAITFDTTPPLTLPVAVAFDELVDMQKLMQDFTDEQDQAQNITRLLELLAPDMAEPFKSLPAPQAIQVFTEWMSVFSELNGGTSAGE